MTKNKKPLYLTVTISPFGAEEVIFNLSHKKPDPYHKTRGEGNCMVFTLTDWDFSTNFKKALDEGLLVKDYGDFDITADLSKIPDKKLKHEKNLAEIRKLNNYID